MIHLLIQGPKDTLSDERLYWSNKEGWSLRPFADKFTDVQLSDMIERGVVPIESIGFELLKKTRDRNTLLIEIVLTSMFREKTNPKYRSE